MILATNTSALSVGRDRGGGRRTRSGSSVCILQPGPADGAGRGRAGRRDRSPSRTGARACTVVGQDRRSPGPISPGSSSIGSTGRSRSRRCDLSRRRRTVEAIDAAMREAGFPMGPFELMDLAGLDVNLAAAHGVWTGLGQPERLRLRRSRRGSSPRAASAASPAWLLSVRGGRRVASIPGSPIAGTDPRCGTDPDAHRDGDRGRGQARARGRCRGARRHRNGIATGRCVPGTLPGGSPRLGSVRTRQPATGCPAVWRIVTRQRIAPWKSRGHRRDRRDRLQQRGRPLEHRRERRSGVERRAVAAGQSLPSRASCCRTMPRRSRPCCVPRCAASHRSRPVAGDMFASRATRPQGPDGTARQDAR